MEVVEVEIEAVDIVGDTVKFLLDCKKKGEILGNQVPPSIYMVPSVVRSNIGRMRKKCDKACYAGSMSYNDFELAKMMLIDGCFILEFIQSLSEASYGPNVLITRSIIYDLLVIENQIPFFVLEIIYECTFATSGRMVSGASLATHMEVLLEHYKIFKEDSVVRNVSLASTPDHIIGFVHGYYQPTEAIPSGSTSSTKGHSAMELDRAGMSFKPNEDQNWSMAMKLELTLPLFSWFSNFRIIPQFSLFLRPTLKMPIAFLYDSTEMVLRNLIIYEHSSDVKRYVTSYVYAMDLLIDTPQDVAVLVKSKVLCHYLGSNENAANMINKLCKELVVTQFFYHQQWEEMDAYYSSYWPNTLAGLKRTYFNSPWNIIALIATIILFVLIMAQTIYTIKDANSTNMEKPIAQLVFIPAPMLGHMMSTIETAKLLVSRDHHISITILIIKPPGPMGSTSAFTTYIESLAKNTMDRISVTELLPQEETPPPAPNSKHPMEFFKAFINSHCRCVRNLVANMISQPGSGRVAGFIVDMFCTGMIDVANEFDIPTYVFFSTNAAILGFNMYLQTLSDDLKQDVIEMISNADAVIPVPCFVKPVPTKVVPVGLQTKEELDFFLETTRRLREAKAIIVNTFLEIETHAIKSLWEDSSIPSVYPVGPILNLEGGVSAKEQPENDVIGWLDGQPPSSVVFLCFGSMGCFGEVQVKQIAHALERSGYRFVWVLRQPPSDQTTTRDPSDYEDPRAILPEGFLERTAGIGKVTGWVPQVELLAHQAVGGFVSHCGWNSLLESLWFGVPSAAWPIYAEQQMNAFKMVVELGLAVEIKMDYRKDLFNHKADEIIVTAEEIERGIRRLMEDNDVRIQVKEMSQKSRAALMEGGSSYASVGCLIQDFISNIS